MNAKKLFAAFARRAVPPALPSWEAACRAAGSYDDALVNRFRVARAAGRAVDGSLLQHSVLSLVAPLLQKPDIAVTDFGGAAGDLGADFLAAYPGAQYVVVENPTMVALMQGKSACSFTTEMPAACDIFYTSSTLQYLASPLAVLEQGLASARHYAVLVRNSFSEKPQFRAQSSRLFDNGNGPLPAGFTNETITYPHRTLAESEVLVLAQAKGFRLIARLEENSGAIDGTTGRQLVFARKAKDR